MSDKWICLRCKELNRHASNRCSKCNGLKLLHGQEVVKIQCHSNVAYVRPPTIMRRLVVLSGNSSDAISRCPSCKGILFASDEACIHCGHFLSAQELKEQPIKNLFSFSFYFQSVFLCILILFILYMLFQ